MEGRKLLWFAALAALAASPACSSKATSSAQSGSASSEAGKEAELASMTPDEVEAGIAKNDGKFFVFDNNTPEVFAKGHLPGAKWVEFSAVKESDLPSDKGATLVFYCANEH